MSFSQIDYVYILLFVSALLLVEGLYLLLADRRAAGGGRNRRMRLIAAGAAGSTALARLRRGEMDRASAAIARILPSLERMIRTAGLTISVRRFGLVCLIVAAVAAMMLRVAAGLPLAPALLGGAVAGFALPVLALQARKRRRIAQFGQQFPEALDMMVRCLRASHPINAAIAMVATEMDDPIGTEFGIVVDEMTYGLDLHGALLNLAERVPHPDLRYFVVTVQIQHNTGGNLGEALSNLSSVIRDRFAMKSKVKALTSQGRSAALVIGLMPVATAMLINVLNKNYFGEVMNDPLFLPALGVAAGLMVAGHVVIHRLVNFRI